MAIMTAFHNLPDPHMVEERGTDFPKQGALMVVVRQVWQLNVENPRLIEASVEWTTEFDTGQAVVRLGLIEDFTAAELTLDLARSGQDCNWPGTRRKGLFFCDQSLGQGEPKPYYATYTETEWTASEPIDGLVEFVSRF